MARALLATLLLAASGWRRAALLDVLRQHALWLALWLFCYVLSACAPSLSPIPGDLYIEVEVVAGPGVVPTVDISG